MSDRIRDPLVRATRLVLVDQRRPLTVVAHPCHQVFEARAAVGRELATGVAQIMEVQARRFAPPRPPHIAPGVRPCGADPARRRTCLFYPAPTLRRSGLSRTVRDCLDCGP